MRSKLFLWTSDIFSCHFFQVYQRWKSLFLLAFVSKFTNCESFGFIGIFVQVYQRWKFCLLLAFLSKFTNGESFGFYWHFCPSLQMVKVLGFIGFCPSLPRWKFWFLLAFLSRSTNGESFGNFATVSFIGHFGYEYQWWKLCDLEFASEQPLASRSATREFAFARGNLWHPAVQTGVRTPGGNCWHGFRSTHIHTGRESVKRLHELCCKAHLSVNIV